MRDLLGWPWTINRIWKNRLVQNWFKASGIMVDPWKEIWTQKEEQHGKYDEFSSGLAKFEIWGRPSSRHFYHATQKIRMKPRREVEEEVMIYTGMRAKAPEPAWKSVDQEDLRGCSHLKAWRWNRNKWKRWRGNNQKSCHRMRIKN